MSDYQTGYDDGFAKAAEAAFAVGKPVTGWLEIETALALEPIKAGLQRIVVTDGNAIWTALWIERRQAWSRWGMDDLYVPTHWLPVQLPDAPPEPAP